MRGVVSTQGPNLPFAHQTVRHAARTSVSPYIDPLRPMPDPLSDDQVRRLRLHAQHLTPRSDAASEERLEASQEISDVVRQVGGLQAQDARAAALSVRARHPQITLRDVKRALTETRSVVRTWLMRGTLHLAATEDVPWLLAALAPRFKKTSRRRREELGLDDETVSRAAKTLEETVRHRGPLTRSEIRTDPALDDVPLDGQAAPYLLQYAALEGRVCHGPERDGTPTYVALDDWIDSTGPLPTDEAHARLTRRYLKAYGPATPRDMARWSGLTLTQTRKNFAYLDDERTKVTEDDEPAWMLAESRSHLDNPSPRLGTRLLPKYDTLLLGYESRDWILPVAHAKNIYPGGGLLRRSVLADGRIAGTWDPKTDGEKNLRVEVELFEEISSTAREQLAEEARSIGRFLGRTGTLEIV